MKQLSKRVHEIMKDPSAAYDSPHEVMNDNKLTTEEKEKILECWEEDEEAKQRATSENMTPPKKKETTGETLALISKLRAKLS